MRALLLILLSVSLGLAGCAPPDTTEAAVAGPVEEAPPALATIDEEAGLVTGPRAFWWNGTVLVSPSFRGSVSPPHARIGAGPVEWESHGFNASTAKGWLDLEWDAPAPGMDLDVVVHFGSEKDGWNALARAAGASPLRLEWDGGGVEGDDTRRVLIRVESADRGTGPLEARVPLEMAFNMAGVVEPAGLWTVRSVR